MHAKCKFGVKICCYFIHKWSPKCIIVIDWPKKTQQTFYFAYFLKILYFRNYLV